ncbi:hypothetical protein F4776DRAFT_663389 [Hypoxylon sp. NC0597]|nr:hypothetical protein F4776DRAFT_663389 [Hypoxylon sp. NC0597]
MESRSVGSIFSSKTAKYNILSTEEPIENKFSTIRPDISQEPKASNLSQHGVLKSWGVAIIAVLILLSGLLAAILVHSYSSSPHTNGLHCGTSNTTAEAESLGCVFDILSYSWTPKQCFDEETATEFSEWLREPERQMGPFPFFYDLEGKNRVQDERALGETFGAVIHTTQEEHLAHCTFMMRRIHRVAESNGRLRLNSRYGNVNHTKHCSHEILKSLQREDLSYLGGVRSRFGVSFERC